MYISKGKKMAGKRQLGAATTTAGKQAKVTLSIMSDQEEGSKQDYSSVEIMAAINKGNKAIINKIKYLNSTLKTL